jgi:pimeloyl-ACP methyl ester carboxylesterase
MKWNFPAAATALCLSKSTHSPRLGIMEQVIYCSDGMQLSGQRWTQEKDPTTKSQQKKVLCLHGWLDNSASFHLVAPELHKQIKADVFCLDFPGHGRSSHRGPDAPIQLISEYAIYVAETIERLHWWNEEQQNNIILIGHSMGAAVAMIYAAAFPEQIHKLILLEGGGPMTRNNDSVTRSIRRAITRRIQSNRTLFPHLSLSPFNDEKNQPEPTSKTTSSSSSPTPRRKIYPTLISAIQARKLTADLSPGKQYISDETARQVVGRATITINQFKDSYDPSVVLLQTQDLDPNQYNGPVVFTHDPRLQWPSLQYFTQEQVEQLYRDVQCPVYCIYAKDGWPKEPSVQDAISTYLKPQIQMELPGSHHFHSDPQDAKAVIDAILQFINDICHEDDEK